MVKFPWWLFEVFNYFAFAGSILCFQIAFIFLFLHFKLKTNTKVLQFSIIAFGMATIALIQFLTDMVTTPQAYLWLFRIEEIVVILTLAFYVNFALNFVGRGLNRLYSTILFETAVFLSILSLTGGIWQSVVTFWFLNGNIGFYCLPGPFYPLTIVMIFASLIFAYNEVLRNKPAQSMNPSQKVYFIYFGIIFFILIGARVLDVMMLTAGYVTPEFFLIGVFIVTVLSGGALANDIYQSEISNRILLREIKIKEDAANELAHDFRIPITIIKGYTENLLSFDTLDKESQSNFYKKIIRQCDLMNRLASNMLDIAKLGAGKKIRLRLSNISLFGLLEELVIYFKDSANTQKKLDIQLINKLTQDSIVADSDKLSQIMSNFIENSIKYSKDSIEITIKAEEINDNFIKITIEDNGIGMTVDQINHTFQMYNRLGRETSKISGTGMGLSIAKKLVEIHGGNIEIESQKDIGTKIWFTIPGNLKILEEK